jgi:hypothetical protein
MRKEAQNSGIRTMAKGKKSKKTTARKARRAVRVPRAPSGDIRANALARALMDPCNAPLEPGCYPGQMGFVSRFSQVYTISMGAAQTAFGLVVTPNNAISWSTAQAALNTALAGVSFTNANVPGAPFMTANCRSTRCLGACFQFFTNAAPLNAQGTFYFGVAPHSLSANGLASLEAGVGNLQAFRKVDTSAYELKWKPGALDEQYGTPNTNVTSDNWDDINSLVLIGGGFPVNSTITVKVTLIMEWLPNTGIGLATPAAANPSNIKPTAVVAALDAKDPDWFIHKIGQATNFLWKNGGKQLAGFASQLAMRAAGTGLMALAL